MTADLLVLVPSRGRPGNIADLWESWKETTTGRAALMVCVDDDDPTLDGYRQQWAAAGGAQSYGLTVGPRERLGGTLNTVSARVAGDYPALGFMGDDHRPRTAGWDERYMQALAELGTGFVYGNDLIQGINLPTQVAMTSDIVRSLGWMCPPGMVHMWLDNVWLELGRALGKITYLPDVVVEHMHFSAGKSPRDAQYEEVNNPTVFNGDKHRFEDWQRFSMSADVARLQELITRG
jgi:hypothetical protein